MFWFEINKIFAALIIALLIFIGIEYIGEAIINPVIPEEQAYKIEIPESSINQEITSSSVAQDVDIDPISQLLVSASLNDGEKIAKKCVSCHNFQKGEPDKIGPNLFEIIGNSIGSKTGYAYSKAMASFGGKWGYEEINKFLYKPKQYMEGTKMNFAGLKKVEDRANLILWLRNNSDNPFPLP